MELSWKFTLKFCEEIFLEIAEIAFENYQRNFGKRLPYVCQTNFSINFWTNLQRNFWRTSLKICRRNFGKFSHKTGSTNLKVISEQFQRQLQRRFSHRFTEVRRNFQRVKGRNCQSYFRMNWQGNSGRIAAVFISKKVSEKNSKMFVWKTFKGIVDQTPKFQIMLQRNFQRHSQRN